MVRKSGSPDAPPRGGRAQSGRATSTYPDVSSAGGAESRLHSSEGSPGGPLQATFEGDLALVVDDEEHVRSMLAELLGRAGWRCLQAADAEQALALLEEQKPRLGILDLALPGMNGAELAWKIHERMPEMSLVALSGHLCKWDRDDLADLGFDRIFAKPMDCEEFVKFCREWRERSRPKG